MLERQLDIGVSQVLVSSTREILRSHLMAERLRSWPGKVTSEEIMRFSFTFGLLVQ